MAGDECVRKIATIFMFLVVAIFNHLSKTLPEHERTYLHDNLLWMPMVAAILVVIFQGCLNQRLKDTPTIYILGKLGVLTKFNSPHAICAQVPQLFVLCL